MSIQGYHASHRMGIEPFYMGKNRIQTAMLSEAGARLLYGIEYEVEFENYTSTFGRIISDRLQQVLDNRLKCESDGSLDDGFECISYPATLACHRSTYGWEKFFEVLHDYEDRHQPLTSDEGNNGMHVHVSRAGLGKDINNQSKCIAKIVYLVDKFPGVFEALGGREFNNYCDNIGAGIEDTDRVAIAVSKAIAPRGRYYAINLTNSATVEFRFFAVDNTYDGFIANIELVDRIVDICKTTTYDTLKTWTRDTLFAALKSDKHPKLKAKVERIMMWA